MTFSEKTNVKAASWTIGVHVLLLLLFIFWKYTLPITVAAPEMGMEVNLGTSDNGSGTDQPLSEEDPTDREASVAYKSAPQKNVTSKDMMQSNEADAPTINQLNTTDKRNNNFAIANNNKHKGTEQQTNINNAHHPQSPRYVYKGSSGKGGNGALQNMPGTNEGNTTGEGDRGVPNGTPGASNYVGSPGNGTGGINYNLTGRNIVAYPPPEAAFREEGKVTIRITVNRDGAIIDKQVISASNGQLRSLALHKLEKVRFNKSDAAPEEQFGNITFVFKTRS
ncbi:MAG TPA: energy transducer TonB [Flavipsychrobacter sp.]|nr:energy transducer TonB [Flavipsychrobacter sp.]